MDFLIILLVVGATFGLCFLADKLFTKTFRGQKQHRSGKSVRLNAKYGSIGAIFMALGVAALLTGLRTGGVLLWGGPVVGLLGVGLVVYYLTFGIYYDEDGFLTASFGKKSVLHRYGEIVSQQVYITGANVVVELFFREGGSVSVHGNMVGMYDFLDYAFTQWCKETHRDPEDCDFHHPENHCWFPAQEGA